MLESGTLELRIWTDGTWAKKHIWELSIRKLILATKQNFLCLIMFSFVVLFHACKSMILILSLFLILILFLLSILSCWYEFRSKIIVLLNSRPQKSSAAPSIVSGNSKLSYLLLLMTLSSVIFACLWSWWEWRGVCICLFVTKIVYFTSDMYPGVGGSQCIQSARGVQTNIAAIISF